MSVLPGSWNVTELKFNALYQSASRASCGSVQPNKTREDISARKTILWLEIEPDQVKMLLGFGS